MGRTSATAVSTGSGGAASAYRDAALAAGATGKPAAWKSAACGAASGRTTATGR